MSDRIAVFNDGRIQQLCAAAGAYELPENSFVASFIGENNACGHHPGTQWRQGAGAAGKRRADRRHRRQYPRDRPGRPRSDPARAGRIQARADAARRPHHPRAQVRDVVYMGDILRAGCASPDRTIS